MSLAEDFSAPALRALFQNEQAALESLPCGGCRRPFAL